MTLRASARMAAKPGDDTPTMTGSLPERFDHAAGEGDGLGGVELRRLAHDAEDGEAGDAAAA